MKRVALILLLVATPAAARDAALETQVRAALAEAGPGTRFGLLVVDEGGKEVVAINPDDRFVPASNTKIYSTAAAFATLPDVTQPDTVSGASVRLDGRNVVLEGFGDARLSSAPDCATNCLSTLADAVAAKTKSVGDVIGDDSYFPDERWSPGMAWNNIQTRSGTGISALTIDDNEYAITVTPGAAGQKPRVESTGYYAVENGVTTVAAGTNTVGVFRAPNQRNLRLSGEIVAGGAPVVLRIGIDDPAEYAAWRLRALLAERKVKVRGKVLARHRPLTPADDPEKRAGAPVAVPAFATPLAKLTPPPVFEDLTVTNKVSQNVHADLFLRRVARAGGSGSLADGHAVVRAMMDRAGVPRWGYDFSDGSGMSTYNRVSPRATVGLLRWTMVQPWGARFRETLPIGGVDGTLANRFKGTPLEGKVFAKTGTLNQSNALGGFLTTARGRTLTFAVYANDMPDNASATKFVDNALNLIAAKN